VGFRGLVSPGQGSRANLSIFYYPVNCSNVLFERILLHFCFESLYFSLHCDKKWGSNLAA